MYVQLVRIWFPRLFLLRFIKIIYNVIVYNVVLALQTFKCVMTSLEFSPFSLRI